VATHDRTQHDIETQPIAKKPRRCGKRGKGCGRLRWEAARTRWSDAAARLGAQSQLLVGQALEQLLLLVDTVVDTLILALVFLDLLRTQLVKFIFDSNDLPLHAHQRRFRSRAIRHRTDCGRGACKIIDCRHKLKVHAAVPTKSQPNATHRSSEIEIAQCVWGGIHDHTSRR